MTLSPCLLSTLLCLPKFLISETRIPKSGTTNSLPIPSNDQAVHAIESTPFVHHNYNDTLRWAPIKDGICTTKVAYSHLSSQEVHQLPTQGPRNITDDANRILHKVSKCKLIPPILKTFAWRLIRRALATGARVGTFSVRIDNNCDYCGHVETDQHLSLTCNLPTQVWFIANPSLVTNQFPVEDDGVQLSLSLLLQHDTTKKALCNNMFLLWYIWKARNDKRFQRRTWTANQVQQATTAHMHAHLDALKNPTDWIVLTSLLITLLQELDEGVIKHTLQQIVVDIW